MATFPRAKLCRFNEVAGCAPPPGTYEPKIFDKLPLGLFDRTERFASPKQPPPKAKSPQPERSTLLSNASRVKKTPALYRSQSVRCSRSKRNMTNSFKSREKQCEFVKLPTEMVSVASTANFPCSRCVWIKKNRSKSLGSLKKLQERLEEQMMKIQKEAVKQDDIKKIIQELADVIPNFEIKLRDVEAEKDNLNKRISSLQSEMLYHRCQICALTDCVDELTAHRNDLINQKTQFIEQIKQKDEEISKSHANVETLKEDLASEKLKNTHLSTKVGEIYRELLNDRESVSKLKEEIAVAQLALANKAEECQQLENIARSCKEQLSTVQRDLEMKTKECLELEKVASSAKEEQVAQYKEAREENVRITELLCLVQDECDKNKRAYDDLADRAEDVLLNFNALKKSHDHLIENAEECMSKLIQEIKINFGDGSDDEAQDAPLNISESQTRLVQKQLSYLSTAVGRIIKITLEYQERNSTLEREIECKNGQIQDMELLIGPFHEQLKEYEQERLALTAVTNETKKELLKISLQQAASLGHQNHKQKIKYLVQLKEANLKLKEEVSELQAKLIQKDRMLWNLTKVGAPGSATPRGLAVRGKENSSKEK